jgi:hypothetical protein
MRRIYMLLLIQFLFTALFCVWLYVAFDTVNYWEARGGAVAAAAYIVGLVIGIGTAFVGHLAWSMARDTREELRREKDALRDKLTEEGK